MKWWEILTKALPFVLNMTSIAEEAFKDEPKSGAKKKALVVAATRSIIGGVHAVSTGGQKETWEQLAKPVDQIIDAAASSLFGDK